MSHWDALNWVEFIGGITDVHLYVISVVMPVCASIRVPTVVIIETKVPKRDIVTGKGPATTLPRIFIILSIQAPSGISLCSTHDLMVHRIRNK